MESAPSTVNPDEIRRISGIGPYAGGTFGEKGLRLCRLHALGFPVPDGILLSVEFLARAVREMGADDIVESILEEEAGGAQGLDKRFLEALGSREAPEGLLGELLGELRTVVPLDPGVELAVRSAAVGEDSSTHSYAGQYRTILHVAPEGLWPAILECYAAWWNDAAVAYRRRQEIAAGPPRLSIIVQRQLFPRAAGVVFTQHPLRKSDLLVVESVAGEGEALVSARATPARWEIDRGTRAIRSFVPDPEVTFSDRPDFLDDLVALALRLEPAFGSGLDLEWAWDGSRLYVLQVRSITTLGSRLGMVYSRAVLEDLWSDRMSPITSSIIFDEFSDIYTFKAPLRKLGLDEIAEIAAVRVVRGYAYLSAQAVASLLQVVPRQLRFREFEKVFPSFWRQETLATPLDFRRVMKLLPRLPRLLDDPAIVPFFTVPLLRRHLRQVREELEKVPIETYAGRDAAFLLTEFERVLRSLRRLLTRNQWGYGNAIFVTWFLYHAATRLAGRSEAWVLRQLKTLPGNVVQNLHRDLEAIARAADDELRLRVFSLPDRKMAWDLLQKEYPTHEATLAISAFVSRYRFRSSNRDFIHPRWDEQPEQVLELVDLLLENRSGDRIREQKHHEGEPSRALLGDGLARLSLFPLVSAARKFLALREDLRFGLDGAFYRIRRLLLAAGELDSFREIRAIDARAVFFLELGELRDLLQDTIQASMLASVVRERVAEFDRGQDASPPFYIQLEEDRIVDLSEAPSSKARFEGIAAAPGVCEGPAVVVLGPGDFSKVHSGAILVAYNTDPGWTPLFLTASGVVVEMGGILNHCAIVAREYGRPAVVGIAGVTRMIRDGDRVRVNGYAGTVEILPAGQA